MPKVTSSYSFLTSEVGDTENAITSKSSAQNISPYAKQAKRIPPDPSNNRLYRPNAKDFQNLQDKLKSNELQDILDTSASIPHSSEDKIDTSIQSVNKKLLAIIEKLPKEEQDSILQRSSVNKLSYPINQLSDKDLTKILESLPYGELTNLLTNITQEERETVKEIWESDKAPVNLFSEQQAASINDQNDTTCTEFNPEEQPVDVAIDDGQSPFIQVLGISTQAINNALINFIKKLPKETQDSILQRFSVDKLPNPINQLSDKDLTEILENGSYDELTNLLTNIPPEERDTVKEIWESDKAPVNLFSEQQAASINDQNDTTSTEFNPEEQPVDVAMETGPANIPVQSVTPFNMLSKADKQSTIQEIIQQFKQGGVTIKMLSKTHNISYAAAKYYIKKHAILETYATSHKKKPITKDVKKVLISWKEKTPHDLDPKYPVFKQWDMNVFIELFSREFGHPGSVYRLQILLTSLGFSFFKANKPIRLGIKEQYEKDAPNMSCKAFCEKNDLTKSSLYKYLQNYSFDKAQQAIDRETTLTEDQEK